MRDTQAYVHGYSEREQQRLADQADTLADLLHHDTSYPAGSAVLEAGCGVGAQTVSLAARSPDARIIAIDLSEESLAIAQARVRAAGCNNVVFEQADVYSLRFARDSFDHVFACFILEHLSRPQEALTNLRSVIKPSGTITVIEGDHGSAYFHPDSLHAHKTIECLVELQRRAGGDALIGRKLFPLLTSAGFRDIAVTPRMVYVDTSHPRLVDGFTRRTFIAMVEGVREQALAAGLIDGETWAKGVRDLYSSTERGGTFCYAFFKAVAKR